MKRFDKFTSSDLWDLRKQICLGSIYVSDYRNSMGIEEHCCCDFFDGYLEFLYELADPEERCDDVVSLYDNEQNLYEWYCCFESYDWVVYDHDEE